MLAVNLQQIVSQSGHGSQQARLVDRAAESVFPDHSCALLDIISEGTCVARNVCAAGKFDEPFTGPGPASVAYDIRVARLTRWTFDVDLDDGSVAEAMTSEDVPESETNCVPESREERFRRVVHRCAILIT